MKSLSSVFGLSILLLSACGGPEADLAPAPQTKSDVKDGQKPVPYTHPKRVEIPEPKTEPKVEDVKPSGTPSSDDAEAQRQAEEAQRQADAQRQAEEAQRQADAQRQAEEAQRQADAQRQAEEAQRQADAQRQAEEAQRQADAQRQAEEAQRQAEEAQRQAEEAQRQAGEAQRQADAETARLAQEAKDAADAAEAARLLQEAKDAADAAEAARLAQEAKDAADAEAARLDARPTFELSDDERIQGFKILTKDELDAMDTFKLANGNRLMKCESKDLDDRHIVATDQFLKTLVPRKEGYVWPVWVPIETKIAPSDYSWEAMTARWWHKKDTIEKRLYKEFICKW